MEILRELYRNFSQMFVWWVVVAPWEQVVRVRLGKHLKVMYQGVHFKIPLIDDIYRQTIRKRVIVTKPQTIATKDQKVITLSGQITYQIGDLKLLYLTLHHAESVIEAESRSAISEFIIERSAIDVSPGALQQYVRQQLALEKYGIVDAEFYLNNFAIARTHRLITGEIHDWQEGDNLSTSRKEESTSNLINY
jgi:hypothetical protein